MQEAGSSLAQDMDFGSSIAPGDEKKRKGESRPGRPIQSTRRP